MILDIIGISVVILFFIRGYMKGIIVAVLSLLAIVFGVLCSLKLSERLASYLLEREIITSGWAQIVSFVVLLVGVVILVNIMAKALDTMAKAMMLGWLNRLIGGLVYMLLGAFMWSAALWLANQMHLLSPETIAYSKTYDYFIPIAPWMFDKIGVIIPMAKDVFADLQAFFSNVNQHLPEHVGTP